MYMKRDRAFCSEPCRRRCPDRRASPFSRAAHHGLEALGGVTTPHGRPKKAVSFADLGHLTRTSDGGPDGQWLEMDSDGEAEADADADAEADEAPGCLIQVFGLVARLLLDRLVVELAGSAGRRLGRSLSDGSKAGLPAKGAEERGAALGPPRGGQADGACYVRGECRLSRCFSDASTACPVGCAVSEGGGSGADMLQAGATPVPRPPPGAPRVQGRELLRGARRRALRRE